MARTIRDTLKSFFQTGDVPTEGQYVDLIDSQLNVVETTAQTVAGAVTFTSAITCSGNISSSGTIIADNFQSTGGDDQISFTDNLNITGHITASGNISASGEIFSQTSASIATLIATNKTAQEASASKWQTLTTAEVDQLENIDSNTISNTQWGYLGSMNQSVASNAAVSFGTLTLSTVMEAGECNWEGLACLVEGRNMEIPLKNIPELAGSTDGGKYSITSLPLDISNDSVTRADVIVCNSLYDKLDVMVTRVGTGKFSIALGNPETSNFQIASASIKCKAL